MTYTMLITSERVKHLVDELGSKIEVVGQDGDFSRVKLTIENGFDLICVFHAGIKVGMH